MAPTENLLEILERASSAEGAAWTDIHAKTSQPMHTEMAEINELFPLKKIAGPSFPDPA
ncbi:UNVERIFIED_CONTAM: hypothetical protein Sangu_2528900 [Sesamum angustifolium]|uniref:Uncharacterized protein n=1 Tax=Sesamum angustifolium TaxID=2727405 RepID=A0AAW2JF12_9LAMI